MGPHARRPHGVGDAPAEVQPAGASEHIGARVPEGDAEMVAAAVRTVSVQRRALGDELPSSSLRPKRTNSQVIGNKSIQR